jgi:hypothetical protein
MGAGLGQGVLAGHNPHFRDHVRCKDLVNNERTGCETKENVQTVATLAHTFYFRRVEGKV